MQFPKYLLELLELVRATKPARRVADATASPARVPSGCPQPSDTHRSLGAGGRCQQAEPGQQQDFQHSAGNIQNY